MQLHLLTGIQPTGFDDTELSSDGNNCAAYLWRGAEYLVAADLSFAGYDVYFSAAGMAYDLMVDQPSGFFRIQVKSTSLRVSKKGQSVIERAKGVVPFRCGYIFEPNGKGVRANGLKGYVGRADVLALVALDLRRVFYRRVDRSLGRRLTLKKTDFSQTATDLSRDAAFGSPRFDPLNIREKRDAAAAG